MLDKEEKLLGQRKTGKIKGREEREGTGKGGKKKTGVGGRKPHHNCHLLANTRDLRVARELLQESGERAPSPGPAPSFSMSPRKSYLGLSGTQSLHP